LGFGEQALEYGKKALAVARIGNWPVRLMWILANIGQAHMLLENFHEAESSFNEANDLAITIDEIDWFFIVQINQEICKLLRITDRDNGAEVLEQRVKTIQEIIGKE
jgi:tetratricopeptide (TPR) repeat protein